MENHTKGEAAIECQHLCLRYRDGTVGSDDINLTIRRGELFGLLGPNGAGKTTLVRQLSLDLKPQSGAVRVFGSDAWQTRDVSKSRFGVIPQQAGLFGGLTVEEHVRCFAPLKGVTKAQVATETTRVIHECDLGEIRKKYVQRLSGGQQRRVLVALALLGSPDILILDEPTTGLDPSARRNLWDTIRRQCAEGKTIVLTSHYLDEIEALAERVGFIERGKLLHVGTPSELAAALPHGVRVTGYDPVTGATAFERLFASVAEARQFVDEQRLANYAITRLRLEDVYFHLVGNRLEMRAEA
jgi:ABC-2 type transport system ATP-binding protein